VRDVVTKKNVITPALAEPKAKTPSPREKLKIKTQGTTKADDWYEAAYKRFSISQNRIDNRRDMLATLRPPIKSEL